MFIPAAFVVWSVILESNAFRRYAIDGKTLRAPTLESTPKKPETWASFEIIRSLRISEKVSAPVFDITGSNS